MLGNSELSERLRNKVWKSNSSSGRQDPAKVVSRERAAEVMTNPRRLHRQTRSSWSPCLACCCGPAISIPRGLLAGGRAVTQLCSGTYHFTTGPWFHHSHWEPFLTTLPFVCLLSPRWECQLAVCQSKAVFWLPGSSDGGCLLPEASSHPFWDPPKIRRVSDAGQPTMSMDKRPRHHPSPWPPRRHVVPRPYLLSSLPHPQAFTAHYSLFLK